jgi:hypothetical protein
MGLQLSGSVQLEGNLLVTGSANSVFENITVTGKLTTQEIETQFVSSSILYSSGSNKFGDLVTDTQQFTGSVNLSGSLIINGNVAIGTPYADESFTINGYSNGTSRLRLFNQGTLIGALGSYLGIVGFGGANDLLLLAPNDLVFGGGNAEKARLSGNNLLMGVTSSAWWTNSTAIQLPQFASLSHQNNGSLNLMSFALETSSDTFTYADTGVFPLRYNQNPNNGTHTWSTAPTGTAGDTINFTSSMSLTTAGSLGIGVAPVEYSFFDTNTLQIKRATLASDNTFNAMRLSHNINYSANNFRFIASGVRTTMYQQQDGNHYFYTSPAGTAGGAPNFTASLTLSNTGAATFANSVTAGSGLINGTTDAFFDLNRSASGNASRVRFQTTGTDEFEIGLKGGVPGFHITSGDATELLTISGSNVGVGTVNPNGILHVSKGAADLYVESTGGAGNTSRLILKNTAREWRTGADTDGNFWHYDGTAAQYRFWIDSSGLVGVNYNNSAIHTYGSSAYSAQLTVKASSASALTLLNSTTGGDAQVAINFVNEFISGQYNYIARIIAEPEGSWDSNASTRDSRLTFFTTLNGSTNDAMSISSAGQIMLGSASTGASGLAVMYYGGGFANQTTLDTDTRFQGPNTSVAAAKCYAWNTYSDQRIKKEINPLTYGLSKILQLNPVSYNQYDSEIIGDEIVLKETYKSTIGLIAQEVNDLIPEAVGVGNDTELWGLDYDKIIPVLIKAIQEQQSQIEELKTKVEQLQNN